MGSWELTQIEGKPIWETFESGCKRDGGGKGQRLAGRSDRHGMCDKRISLGVGLSARVQGCNRS